MLVYRRRVGRAPYHGEVLFVFAWLRQKRPGSSENSSNSFEIGSHHGDDRVCVRDHARLYARVGQIAQVGVSSGA